MGFRERPEYAEWRAAVMDLFGETCIRCGYKGNIHAHHVLPVHTYPELTFDPNNGVPLCGNCHAEVSGQEMDHASELQELQKRALGLGSTRAPTIDELRQAAEANPSNAEAVTDYLSTVDDPQEAIKFYVKYQDKIPKSALIGCQMTGHLHLAGKHTKAIEFADAALNLARQEGLADVLASVIAYWRTPSLKALGKENEALPYLKSLLDEFPVDGRLHLMYAEILLDACPPGQPRPEECVLHALKAGELCPHDSVFLVLVSGVFLRMGRSKDAIRFAKLSFEHAQDDEDRIRALGREAWVYEANDLYDDAIAIYRRILQMVPENCDVMASVARCLLMQNKLKQARDMARRCLLHDPDNESAKGTLSCSEDRLDPNSYSKCHTLD